MSNSKKVGLATSRALRRRGVAVAAIGAVAATIAGTGGGAHAANPVAQTGVVATVTSGTRTLSLTDGANNPLTSTSNLDATKANTPFGVKVTDSSYGLNSFQVTSTMSNLYQYANGTYTCGTKIPSSGVAAGLGAGSAAESGVSAVLNPVFDVAGTIAGSVQTTVNGLLPALLGQTPTSTQQTVQSVNTTLTGSLPAGLPLDMQHLIGTTAPSIVSGALGQLPLNAANAAGGTYALPDAAPTGSGCTDVSSTQAATATQVPLLLGTANLSGLLAALDNLLSGLSGFTPAPPSVSTLINDGIVTPQQVAAMLSTTLVSGTTLDPTALLTDLGGYVAGGATTFDAITNSLTATLVTAKSTADSLAGIIGPVVSGNYSNTPNLSVNPGSAPGGTYRGQMTVTLMDLPGSLG